MENQLRNFISVCRARFSTCCARGLVVAAAIAITTTAHAGVKTSTWYRVNDFGDGAEIERLTCMEDQAKSISCELVNSRDFCIEDADGIDCSMVEFSEGNRDGERVLMGARPGQQALRACKPDLALEGIDFSEEEPPNFGPGIRRLCHNAARAYSGEATAREFDQDGNVVGEFSAIENITVSSSPVVPGEADVAYYHFESGGFFSGCPFMPTQDLAIDAFTREVRLSEPNEGYACVFTIYFSDPFTP